MFISVISPDAPALEHHETETVKSPMKTTPIQSLLVRTATSGTAADPGRFCKEIYQVFAAPSMSLQDMISQEG
jgi:hypothetical protein